MTSDVLYAASTLADASTTLGTWLSHNMAGILQILVFFTCLSFIVVLAVRKDPDAKRVADAFGRFFTGRYTKYIVIIVMSLSMILSIVKLLRVLFAKE